MTIRPVEKKDLQACIELENICFPIEEAASNENLAIRIEQFPQGFYVMENPSGKIVGHINSGCTHKDDITDEAFKGLIGHNESGKNMVIFSLAISPEYRGNKIGHQLLDIFTKQSRKLNKKHILLLCKSELITYYEQFGFSYSALSQSDHGGAQWHEMILNL